MGQHNLQQTANVSGTAGTGLNGRAATLAVDAAGSAARFRRLLAAL